MYERKDVWTLTNEDKWHPILKWYGKAIATLKTRADDDPTSWTYMAAIHGTFTPPANWPPGATWKQCQHGSWYFLPWHRIYLHYFEDILRTTIVDLGGPSDWALPYWNYSDPSRADVRSLPPAFRASTTPDGSANALYTDKRAASINGGSPMSERTVSIKNAMTQTVYTSTTGSLPAFGGPATGWTHGGVAPGALEQTPHNGVHITVGGTNPPGLMSQFQTAGLDPIFWLHHANIDRLWQVWLDQGNRSNPSASQWRDMKFRLGSGSHDTIMTVAQVIDTTQPPLSYTYQDTSLPTPSTPLAFRTLPTAKAMDTTGAPEHDDDFFPEMVGATSDRVSLSTQATAVEVSVGRPSGPALRAMTAKAADTPTPRKAYLKVENVKATSVAVPTYSVYVNLPEDGDPEAHDDRYAGQLPMFGVIESTQSDDEHGGSGLTFTFDITEVADHLQEDGAWTPDQLRVTFVPDLDADAPDEGDVTAGRVSVHYA